MNKRILMLCSRTPYPLTGGAKLRMYNIAALLAEEFTVELLIIDEQPVTDAARNALQEQFEDIHLFTYPKYRFYVNTLSAAVSTRPLQTHYYEFEAVHEWLDEHSDRYDLLFCNHVRTTEYARGQSIPAVVDLVDAISRNYAQSHRGGIWRAILPVESRRLLRYERRVVAEFEHTFLTTQKDWEYVATNELDGQNVTILPNGVRPDLLEYSSDMDTDDFSLAFLGNMSYYPNVDATTYFVEEIFPGIREQYPNVTFYIVGADPAEEVQALSETPGVVVTGYVDDPATYLSATTVVVAPLRYGAGLQNKVLEAMALGKPVVTTPLGHEGIAAEDGIDLRVADSPAAFQEAVVNLLNAPDERAAMGKHAREKILEQYTWETVKPRLLSPIRDLL